MNFVIDFFKTPGKQCLNIRFRNIQQLTSKEIGTLRQSIDELVQTEFEIIYFDTRDVVNADLSGINEIIHTNYVLQQAGKQLVFIYRQNSAVAKWVHTTCLDKFINTALLPSN